MSWKKILFLCLSLVFIFGGMFGFVEKVFAYGALPTLENSNRQDINYANSTKNNELKKKAEAERSRLDKAREEKEAEVAALRKNTTVTCDSWAGLNLICWGAVLANNVILSVAGLLTAISGLIFDGIIDFSVVKMGENVKTGDGEYISDAWKITRDVVNIAFIFVLLYIGIMTIIKGFESGTSKMIAMVIVVALLINFSLFFTKIIIDGSNIIALNFYNTIQSETASGEKEWSGVAGAFLNTLQLGTVSKDIASKINNSSVTEGKYLNIIKIAIGGSVILIVLALVLFVASAMFITRYIVLIIVLITSAAAIGSWILPSLKTQIYDKWWGALIGQAFFAPVFLFFIFISLRLTQGVVDSTLNGKADLSWSGIFTGDVSSGLNLVIMYLVVVGFLVGSIIVSKQLSNMAGSGAGKITGFMGGAALGAVGLAGRNTVGRLGNHIANSGFVSNLANSNNAFGRVVGGGLMRSGDRLARSSMDVRNVGALEGVTGGMGRAAEGGFSGQIARQTTRQQEILNRRSQPSEPERRVQAGRARDLSNNQRVVAAVAEDLDIIDHNREIERLDGEITRERTELQRATSMGDTRAAAIADASIQQHQTDRQISVADRDRRRDTIVRTESGGRHATFGALNAEIRNITAQSAEQTRNVTRRREQALTNFETSFISTLSTGLNRNRIATSLRNQPGNNVTGGATR